MERRFIEQKFANVMLEQRAEGDESPPKIVGYGAVYYDGTEDTEYVLWDDSYGRAVERIMPGAFSGVIQRPDDVRCLFNHNPDHLLGRTASKTMALTLDQKGLRYEVKPPKSAIAETVMENLRRGDINGSSFNFNVPNGGERVISERDADGRRMIVRELLSLEVFDVGPVTFAAYGGATAEARGGIVGLADLRKRIDRADLPAVIAEAEARAREIELVEAME